MPDITTTKKIIYDSMSDPIVRKQKELWKERYARRKISVFVITIFVVVLLLISIYLSLPYPLTFEMLALISTYLLVFLFVYMMYYVSKHVFSEQTQDIMIFEEGIMYARPFSFKGIPKKQFVPFEWIDDVRLKTIDSDAVIKIILKERINKRIERSLNIWNDSVGDIKEVYDIICKGIDKESDKLDI